MKRIISSIGFGLIALGTVTAFSQQSTVRTQCSLPGKGVSDLGFVAEYGGQYFKCVQTFGSDMKPAGAAWIEVVRDNRFVIKN